MRIAFQGRIWREDDHWLIEIPAFDCITQGTSYDNALAMGVDWVRCMLDDSDFALAIQPDQHDPGLVLVVSEEGERLIALALHQRRLSAGLTVRDAAAKVGGTSPEAWARYESGRTVPTINKLTLLFAAIDPQRTVVIS